MPLDFAAGLTVVIAPPTVPVVRAAPPTPGGGIAVPLAGPQGPAGTPGDTGPAGPAGPPGTPGSGAQSYPHTQILADDTWVITHGLGYHPAGIVAKDSVGDIVEPADITYPDIDTVHLLFGRLISGTAEVS